MVNTSAAHPTQIECSHCQTDLTQQRRSVEATTRNAYCNKTCMGKAQTKRATINLVCSYCKNSYETLKGRYNKRHQFCSQPCSLKVRMDRYFWSICNVLAKDAGWLSADMIRMKLRGQKVDLTSMRIATRIAHNKLIEVQEESEPYLYKLSSEYRTKPWTWHTTKFFRKVEMERHDYVLMFERQNEVEENAVRSD